jgi:AcrR family transcriptional regulator/predicted DNA-binding transcriptional regulator AlpA
MREERSDDEKRKPRLMSKVGMKDKLYMKISELVKESGLPASTIRYYVREGLLPPPIKTGKTMAYYSDEHLARIAYLKELTETRGMSLAEARDAIEREYGEEDRAGSMDANATTNRREAIMAAAIELFREKGLSDTSVGDIVNRAGVGRDTFYLNFKNKDELFIECADRIFYQMYDDIWQEIRDEEDMVERLKKRGKAFFASYPRWRDMINLIRGASVSRNPVFAEKLDHVMRQMIEPNIRDIEKAKKQGAIDPEVNSTIAAYLILGMAEYGAYLVDTGSFEEEEITRAMSGLFDSKKIVD